MNGGEFVQRIRVKECLDHPDGWRKWNGAYLARPPGAYSI
jgi:hypothetical protein